MILIFVSIMTTLTVCGAIGFWWSRRLRGAVQRLENVRREFVANVSHEFKTPLTVIRGYAETLRRSGLEDRDMAERFLKKIEGNAMHLQRLVEDILELSAIESGRREIKPAPVALADFVESLRQDRETSLREKKMSCDIRIPNEFSVRAEPYALKQIFGNLIDNAMTYTPEGGAITISAEQCDHHYKITIADTGIGIPEKHLPHIFERFYRVDKARSRAMGGTGLGLAIVKHLVQAHGGDVGVTSQLGKGSQFFFTITSHD